MVTEIEIKNKPIYHYILSIFSLMIGGKEKIRLKASGRAIGRTIDMVNLLNTKIIPGVVKISLENKVNKSEIMDIKGNEKLLSEVIVELTYNEEIKKDGKIFDINSIFSNDSKINICQLELILGSKVFRDNISELIISSKTEKEFKDKTGPINKKFEIAKIIHSSEKIYPDESMLGLKKLEDVQLQGLLDSELKSKFWGSLIRSGVTSPDLTKLGEELSQSDDVIVGLDTNILYSCLITNSILSSFVGKPSKDFLDTPNWITLVFSKVGLWEIENKANTGGKTGTKKDTFDKRLALRALQELMIIHRSADLEGVSIFLTGDVPPEFGFAKDGKNEIVDSAIRRQFKEFLKSIDFHKGAFFLTQDRTSSILGEAEGLRSVLIEKPDYSKEILLHNQDKINISEVLYELAVSFNPLEIKCVDENGENIFIFTLSSNWIGKDLKNWEDWELEINIIKENDDFKKKMFDWFNERETDEKFIEGWNNLSERFIRGN